MPGLTGRQRKTDWLEFIPTWQEVSAAREYAPVRKLPLPPIRPSDREAQLGLFSAIVEAGAWLQRAVAERWPEADEIATGLSAYAALENQNYENSGRARVAAAYLLWPYHAARYYGYTRGEDRGPLAPGLRLESRQALCQIQALLYNNVRALLDVLRLWFNAFSDRDACRHVYDPNWANPLDPAQAKGGRDGARCREWRDERLTKHAPDLCAVDFLAHHMVELVEARPFIRRAVENIQMLSVTDEGKVSDEVAEAFKKLRVAQMTVFYHPKPFDVKENDEISLYELVHRTWDSDANEFDAIPAKLIPFEGDPKLARNFRKLASTIYSVRSEGDGGRYKKFSEHRQAIINKLNELPESTSFISDGSISNHFLSTEPPLRARGPDGGDDGDGGEPRYIWPLWYRQQLHEFDLSDPPDWGDEFWWSAVAPEDLRRRLFPGDEDDIHKNHHMSSLWDDLVATRREFVDEIVIPDEPPSGESSFGYLMELLLRREAETRTSFFFALAQTVGGERGRLCQFVGGTLLGLERAGVPFSKERFQAIAARMRGLVMAVAHYTTTYATKYEKKLAAMRRKTFNERVATILDLLRGTGGDYGRGGHLLFASPVDGGGTDHAVAWKPSRYQLKAVFTSAEHLREWPPMAGNCNNTWKALFYLGGNAGTDNRLEKFEAGWERQQERDPGLRAGESNRPATCGHCLRAVLQYLLLDDYAKLAPGIQIAPGSITLPSRPGIRFLIALCRFIADVQSQAAIAEKASVTAIEFSHSGVVISFDRPELLEGIWERKDRRLPDTEHTSGTFRMLEEVLITTPGESDDPWLTFLNNPKFATRPEVKRSDDSKQLIVRWGE